VVVGICAVVGSIIILIIKQKMAKSSKQTFGRNLFERLSELHSLGSQEKRLLKRLTVEYDLPDAANCFVKVSFLLDIMERSALGGRKGRRRAECLSGICRKVFGVESKFELESMEV